MPLRLEAAILSRMRSPVTSRSNWANESRTLSVSRPMEVVLLTCNQTESDGRILDPSRTPAKGIRDSGLARVAFGRDIIRTAVPSISPFDSIAKRAQVRASDLL